MSTRPRASRAERIAWTRPSSMSEGAMMSAPASAWATAARVSNSSERSLSMNPGRSSGPGMPQWPWLVYSHRQVSAIRTSDGTARRTARRACWTMPSCAHAPVPSQSLLGGKPNSSSAGIPRSATSRASSTRRSTDWW